MNIPADIWTLAISLGKLQALYAARPNAILLLGIAEIELRLAVFVNLNRRTETR